VRDFVARLNDGADAWSLLSEAAVVTVNGTTPLSGRYDGLSLIRDILVDTAQSVIASLRIEIEEIIGTGTRIAALLHVSGAKVNGEDFDGTGRPSGCVFGVRDGKIDEVMFFPDTSLIEMALYTRKFVPDD